jgi:hypothetical protein
MVLIDVSGGQSWGGHLLRRGPTSVYTGGISSGSPYVSTTTAQRYTQEVGMADSTRQTASANGFSRLPTSPDAAYVWAVGGVERARDQARERSLAIIREYMQGKEWVGIEDNQAWVDQGVTPFLGWGDAKALGGAMVYQKPEYETTMIWSTLNQMSTEELAAFRRQAIRAGLFDDNVVLSDVGPTPADANVLGQLMGFANNTRHSSWEAVLAEITTNPNPDLGDGSGSGSGSGSEDDDGPFTQRQVIYQRTSVDAGRSIIRALMTELIGREPSDGEVRAYTAALNRRESRRPQIIEQVSEMGDNDTETITRRVLSNSPEPTEVLRRSVEDQNRPEMREYRANQYFERLLQVI